MADTKAGELTIKDYGEQVDQDKDKARFRLEALYGQVWDTKQLQEDFEVLGFQAPCVVVIRKADNVKGSLEFVHMPRYYHSWVKA